MSQGKWVVAPCLRSKSAVRELEPLWWVRADGTATIHDDDRAADALANRYPAYVRRPPPDPVVSIMVTRWTGWAGADPTS